MKIEHDSRVVNQVGNDIFVTSIQRRYRCAVCFGVIRPEVKHIYCMGDREHINCGVELMNSHGHPYFYAIVP